MNVATLPVLLGFLRAGRTLDAASSVLLLVTLGLAGLMGLARPSAPGWLPATAALVALALGLFEKYLAWRVALDAEFFAFLREQPSAGADFDQALAEFMGRPAPGGPGRDLPDRWRGARRLVRRQAWALFGQAVLAAALAVVWGLG